MKSLHFINPPARLKPFILLLLVASLPASAQTLDEALATLRELRFEKSAPMFEAIVKANPNSAEARTWLAMNYQYLGRYDDAIAMARGALHIDRCNSEAHTVIADSYARGNRPRATELDSIWTHYMAAVRCDSANGDAWMGLWIQASMRRDESAERASLHALYAHYLTTGTIAASRLILRHLPKRAILVTAGDIDTFGTLAVQQEEDYRSDVAIVNLPMLTLAWYARHVRDRYAIPLTIEDKDLEKVADAPYATATSSRTRRGKKKDMRTLDLRIIDGWLGLDDANRLGRPITMAPGSDFSYLGDRTKMFVLKGGYFDIDHEGRGATIDTEAVAAILSDLNPAEYGGPSVPPNDPSPIRAGAFSWGEFLALTAMQYGEAIGGDRPADALAAMTLAERLYAAGPGTNAQVATAIADAKKRYHEQLENPEER
jgi:tetratricopeptide (TPR) repeat protein